jgi:hypothetical protein
MKKTDENIENQFGNLKKVQPFQVPEGYFETFADRLMIRIEEEGKQSGKKRSLFIYLKPVLMMAASIVLVLFLVSVPIKKFFPSGNGYIAQKQLNTDCIDSASTISATLVSYFSEGQLLAAISDVNELESDTMSTANLADFIAANYSDYDIIASN